MQIDNLFATDGIEKTKEELLEMAKEGTLDENVIKSYSKLNSTLEDSNIVLADGQSAASALCDELYALADAEKSVQGSALNNVPDISATITSSIEQISKQLEPQFSKLKDAYQSIFTIEDGQELFSLDEVDASMLEDLRKSFAEIEEEIGVTFDTSQLENFFAVLTNGNSTAEEVQDAFNGLATSYLFSTDVLNSLNDSTVDAIAKQLESLGVTNATALATEVLATKQEYLAQTGQDLSDATAENINALIEEKAEITEEGIILDSTTQKIVAYWMQKQAANGQLSTVGDIQQLSALCDALGISTKALRNYIYFKKLASMTDVYDEDTIAIFAENAEKQMEQAQKDIQSIYAGFGGTNLDYSPIDSEKAKKSAKDTTESFDWIERALESLQKRFKSLQQVIDSTFSTTEAKTKALADQIGLINKEIELQQYAYEEYMAKAESIGLSDNYKNLVQNGAINIEDIVDKDLQSAIKSYQDYYDKAQDTLDEINSLHEEAMQKHVDCYELEADGLKSKLDSQSITEKQYIDEMLVLWEKYYADQVELAEVAKEKKLELLEEEKSYLQSVANAATALLDNQIDDLEDQKDYAVKVYEEQIEAIEGQIDALEEIKKPLQDQLDMMEKAKDKEEKILALQQAQVALRRAESQRSQLKYVDGQMIYTTDDSAIKDARQDLDDAEYELTKFNIQQEIDAIDKQIDGFNEQIDKINDIITQTEKYYDAQIDGLNKYKDEWQKALDFEELAINMKNFTDMFGENSIGKLLSGDMSLIKDWEQSYADTLAEIDLTSNGTIGEITKQFAELAGIDLSNTSAQTQDVASQFDSLGESVNAATSAIGNTSNTENQQNGTTNADNANEDNSTSLVGAIQTSYDVASEAIPAQVEMMNSYTDSIQGSIDKVNELIASIERLNAMTMNGIGGNAYASGTRKAKKGLALVGEEKPEAIITNDDKVLLAEKPSLINMEGGETVYNGDETEKMLAAKGIRPLREEDNPLLYKISQMNPDDIREKFGISSAMPVRSVVSDTAKSIANSNVVNNNSKPSYVMNGDVNVNCTGVTSQEVVKQIGTEVNKMFFGMENKARQRANITR